MFRLKDIAIEKMTAAQRSIYNRIASGPRQGVRGPLAVWLRAPGLAERAEALGVYCRFENSLGARLNELAILVTVAHWQAGFAWVRHLSLGLEAGLPATALESIRTGVEPVFDADDEKVVYHFLRELLETRTVGELTWSTTVAVLGEMRLVDLIGISGYYGLVAMTLNATGLGSDEENPFQLTTSNVSQMKTENTRRS